MPDWDRIVQEAGDILSDNEAGDEDEGGERYTVFEEGGMVTGIVPEGFEAGARRANLPPMRGRKSQTVTVRSLKREQSRKWRRGVSNTLLELAKGLAAINKRIEAARMSVPDVAGPGDEKHGMRLVLGGTSAIAAPAVVTGTQFSVTITPAAPVGGSYLVAEVYENTYAAVAAGNTLIPGLAVFDVTQVKVAGSDLIRSNTAFIPGGMFGVKGPAYGYPFAAGRGITIGSGSTIIFNGRVFPRAPAGASALNATVGFMAPSLGSPGGL